ncbi:MAG: hypothetical protein F4185_02045 [Chloroflexi bacterium]|nr:hypothetical protein [Chloroflexota bacterium]
MEADRGAEPLDLGPERLDLLVVEQAAVDRLRMDGDADEAQLRHGAACLLNGEVERLQREERDALQPVGVGRAVVAHPVVVRAA